MEKELLNIFDEHGNHTGTAPRNEVHTKGYWHETFHCWFMKKESEKCYLYFQLRSLEKKDYPNLLDITAAGHILSHETHKDGVREIKEETGIDIRYKELVPLGIIPYQVVMDNFIDRERAHLFLYENNHALKDFSLQSEEVSGMFRAEIESFTRLIGGKETSIELDGFEIAKDSKKVFKKIKASKTDFVPHEDSYYLQVLQSIREFLK